MAPLKVLISGGGVAGGTLAYWLIKLGHDVTVVERFPTLRATGLQIDLRGYGIEVLRRMGLEDGFRAKAVPEEGLQFVDRSGKKRAFFKANKSGKGGQGFTSDFEIMRGDLCRLIFDAAGDRVQYKFGTTIASYEDQADGVSVAFADGTTAVYDLVVGADGTHSSMRKMMFGPDAPGVFNSLHEATAYMTFARPAAKGERNIATMYFATGNRLVLTRRHSPDTMQLYLSVKADNARLDHVKRGDVEAEKAAFIDVFRDAGGEVPQLLNEVHPSKDFYCERLGIVKVPAWNRGRVVLLGDAAFSPAGSGMGTTCAVVGAYVLAGEIGRHCGRGDDPAASRARGVEAALASYDRIYRPYMEKVQEDVEKTPKGQLMPSKPWTIATFHLATSLIAALWFDPVAKMFMKTANESWQLPRYEELGHA